MKYVEYSVQEELYKMYFATSFFKFMIRNKKTEIGRNLIYYAGTVKLVGNFSKIIEVTKTATLVT